LQVPDRRVGDNGRDMQHERGHCQCPHAGLRRIEPLQREDRRVLRGVWERRGGGKSGCSWTWSDGVGPLSRPHHGRLTRCSSFRV
jgi:hypothetical protein